jgi:SAM-dependent methyltransferase
MSLCPYCNGHSFSPSYLISTEFNGKIFNYRKCESCGVISVNPFPEASDYLAMYPPDYQGEIFTSGKNNYKNLLTQIKAHCTEGATVLDYGCGNSALICELHEAGFRVSGVEYNPSFVALLKKKISFARFYTIDEFWSDETLKFDVVIFNNVIEHLTNPAEILNKTRHRLQPNGILVGIGPVEDNFSLAHSFRKLVFRIKQMIRAGNHHHPPYHISFTNAENQEGLFRNAGYETIRFEVKEQCWPFPDRFDLKKPIPSLLYLIARLSILISPLFYKKAGNYFIYFGRVKS